MILAKSLDKVARVKEVEMPIEQLPPKNIPQSLPQIFPRPSDLNFLKKPKNVEFFYLI